MSALGLCAGAGVGLHEARLGLVACRPAAHAPVSLLVRQENEIEKFESLALVDSRFYVFPWNHSCQQVSDHSSNCFQTRLWLNSSLSMLASMILR